MRHLQIAPLLIASILFGTLETPLAQNRPASPDSSDIQESDPVLERRLQRFHIEGLPMSEVAEYLRQEFRPVNIIVSPQIANTTLTVKLVDVNAEGILEAIELATEEKVEPVVVHDRLIHFRPGEAAYAAGEPVTRVFNLKYYLQGLEEDKVKEAMEDLEEVVQMTWEATQDARRSMGQQTGQSSQGTTVRFHRGTQLLIVSGPADFVSTYGQVVQQLVHGGAGSGFGAEYGSAGGRYGSAGGFAPGGAYRSRYGSGGISGGGYGGGKFGGGQESGSEAEPEPQQQQR